MIRAAILLCLLAATAGCGQPANRGNTQGGAPAATAEGQSSVTAVAEPFEVLTEQASTINWTAMDNLIANARAAADGVRAQIDPSSGGKLDQQLAAIRVARRANDRKAIALAAVEGYRTVVEAQDPATTSPPIPISLLDYAGFRYQALASSGNVDWPELVRSVAFARQQWSVVGPRIDSPGLRSAFESTLSGMDDAAKSHDAAYARGAAATELALVDTLEEHIARR